MSEARERVAVTGEGRRGSEARGRGVVLVVLARHAPDK